MALGGDLHVSAVRIDCAGLGQTRRCRGFGRTSGEGVEKGSIFNSTKHSNNGSHATTVIKVRVPNHHFLPVRRSERPSADLRIRFPLAVSWIFSGVSSSRGDGCWRRADGAKTCQAAMVRTGMWSVGVARCGDQTVKLVIVFAARQGELGGRRAAVRRNSHNRHHQAATSISNRQALCGIGTNTVSGDMSLANGARVAEHPRLRSTSGDIASRAALKGSNIDAETA